MHKRRTQRGYIELMRCCYYIHIAIYLYIKLVWAHIEPYKSI